jgi:hypothetical protein
MQRLWSTIQTGSTLPGQGEAQSALVRQKPAAHSLPIITRVAHEPERVAAQGERNMEQMNLVNAVYN